MRVLFFTDLHLDNWSAFSTTVAGGYNSRFMQQLHTLEQVLYYAEKRDMPIVFGGDLFNRRLLIPSDVMHKTYELLAKYDKQPIYLVIGNHDIYDWNSANTSLAVLSEMEHVYVVDEPTSVEMADDVHLSLVPHGALLPTSSASLRKEVPNYYDILVTHYGVNEARLGPKDFKMKDDLTVKQLRELGYDLVLLGHIHKPQTLGENIVVMGSVMAHSFHETDEKKFYYVFNTETRELTKINSGAPKFLTIEVSTKAQLKKLVLNDKNYYRLNIMTTKITPADTAKLASRNVIISFARSSGGFTEMDMIKRKVRTIEDEIDDYYESVDTELDRRKLKMKALEVVHARS
jgi:DNA repair exonuclease SbcCD nuclease subunit